MASYEVGLQCDKSGVPLEWGRIRAAAVIDGRTVGEATASPREPQPTPDRRYMRIDSLRVDRRHRQEGIGTQLITEILDWAANNGFSHVSVEASASDAAIDAFYLNAGFRRRSIIYDIDA